MIGIIDYGVGNLFSLKSSLKHIGCDAIVSNNKEELKKATHIILPGVGAFEDAYNKLEATGLIPFIKEEVNSGKPFLGICLGMQLMFDKSYEYGVTKGLSLISGDIVSMEKTFKEKDIKLKVPHIGWNELKIVKESPLLKDIKSGEFVYFVHSYYGLNCKANTVATAPYGVDIPAIMQNKNVYGCQFHPEKSASVFATISLILFSV